MRCETCQIELPDGPTDHRFAGYGFYIGYCPLHCPKTMDGTNCNSDHPPENEHPEPDPER